ncbi:inner membrane protein OXA1L [Coprinopsis marcescibilis]|uniref:Inner membrane protein OXA1L n=1 Tax=Coprinopsis marcescibilis TaxID=230819 RepID=A0A5C3LAR5_COPMA|nr:inner membrane protein OXA1L [Coprinopsis marcescibilis]
MASILVRALRCSSARHGSTRFLSATAVGLHRLPRTPLQSSIPTSAFPRRSYATQPPPVTPLDAASQPESELVPMVESTAESIPFTDAVVAQIPPIAYGDFAAIGLSSWSPIGLIAWSYELINVATGLPWFYTIVAGASFWRFVCVPLALSNIRNSTKLRPFQPAVMAARDRITKAQANRDTIELQRASLEMKKVYAQAGVSPFKGMILPMLAQMPITIGSFFALKRLSASGLEQLKDSGVSISLDLPWSGHVNWLNDLTTADPTYILPVAFCAMINVQIMAGAREMDQSSPMSGHIMNLFRGLSVMTIFLMSSFPTGLFIGLLTTAVLTTAQSLILRSPAVRTMVGIPVLPANQDAKLPSFMESIQYAKDTFLEKKKAAERAQSAVQQSSSLKKPRSDPRSNRNRL